jgi:hypothetical protein
MLQIFPFLAWIAALASLVLLILLWMSGEIAPKSVVPLSGAFLVAAYGQFVSGSQLVNTVGLVLQTSLAICLIVRVKIGR